MDDKSELCDPAGSGRNASFPNGSLAGFRARLDEAELQAILIRWAYPGGLRSTSDARGASLPHPQPESSVHEVVEELGHLSSVAGISGSGLLLLRWLGQAWVWPKQNPTSGVLSAT